MRSETKALKAALVNVPKTWVRVWKDGSMWVGLTNQNLAPEDTLSAATAALQAAGYIVERNGKSGTSGHYVLDVRRK